jgi:hypothetical protein
MSRIVEWFRERLLGPRAPVGRLDRERVLEIARAAAAAAGDPWAADLWMTDLHARGSAKIWVVSTPTIGCSLVVEIDDATEAVLTVCRFEGR